MSVFKYAGLANDLLAETAAVSWIPARKRMELGWVVACEDVFGEHADLFEKRVNGEAVEKELLLSVADTVAYHAEVFTMPNRLVLFSGKKQLEAEEFVIQNPEYDVIHSRPVGAMLEMLNLFDENLDLTRDERYAPWNRAAYNLCWKAQGDVKAIIDKPKLSSTFVTIEMPALLRNAPAVSTINGVEKYEFNNQLRHNLKYGLSF